MRRRSHRAERFVRLKHADFWILRLLHLGVAVFVRGLLRPPSGRRLVENFRAIEGYEREATNLCCEVFFDFVKQPASAVAKCCLGCAIWSCPACLHRRAV